MSERVAIYARVSTESQRNDLPPQVDRLRRLAALRWPKSSPEEFVEIESGAHLRRPILSRLLRQIERRQLDVLVIETLDRLSRSLFDGIMLVDRIERSGCGLVVMDQPVDTTTPAGRAQLQLLQVFAEWQRADLRERARKGIEAAQARGVHCGRRASRAVRTLDLEAVRRRRSVGESLSAIAEDLGVSRFALYRRLRARSADRTRRSLAGGAGHAGDGQEDPHPDS